MFKNKKYLGKSLIFEPLYIEKLVSMKYYTFGAIFRAIWGTAPC